MQLLIFILVYPFVYLISLLPFRVLYFISDCFYILVYHIIGYRKKVVIQNITYAFPEKTEQEKIAIMKKFYHHFVDIFIEMIKSFTISEKSIEKRAVYKNLKIMTDLEDKGKHVIVIGSHYGNWEWSLIISRYIKSKGFGAFNVIENKYFDKKIRKSRERFGLNLVRTHHISALMKKNIENNTLSSYGFLSDQSPRPHKAHYWQKFFGINVPIHTGAEYLAKLHNLPIVMLKAKKLKRGFYEYEIELLTDKPREYEDYQITDNFLAKLEKQIIEKPELYFWTHKRFKHKDKAPKN